MSMPEVADPSVAGRVRPDTGVSCDVCVAVMPVVGAVVGGGSASRACISPIGLVVLGVMLPVKLCQAAKPAAGVFAGCDGCAACGVIAGVPCRDMSTLTGEPPSTPTIAASPRRSPLGPAAAAGIAVRGALDCCRRLGCRGLPCGLWRYALVLTTSWLTTCSKSTRHTRTHTHTRVELAVYCHILLSF